MVAERGTSAGTNRQSGRAQQPSHPARPTAREAVTGPIGDDGDSAGWGRERAANHCPEDMSGAASAADRDPASVPFAELHCHSHFSFLDGASSPEELVEQAARLGLAAIAVTDHDGLYGVVRLAEAGRARGVRTVYGAELSLGMTAPRAGVVDPDGEHLLVVARDQEGYRRLCRVLSAAHLRGGEKGRPVYLVDEVVDELAGHVVVLTGCRKGAVRRALRTGGPAAAAAELALLVDRFGRDHVAVELVDHALPTDSERNDALAALAHRTGLSGTQLDTLAIAGAFAVFGRSRREALWEAGAAAREHPDALPGVGALDVVPSLPGMTTVELLTADAWATGISTDAHPVHLLRAHLDHLGAIPTAAQRAQSQPANAQPAPSSVPHRRWPPATNELGQGVRRQV